MAAEKTAKELLTDPDDPYFGAGPRSALLLEETVLPTPNSVDLSRMIRSDYMLRFDSGTRHVAELFQENTKLTPYSSLLPPATDDQLNHSKRFYFSTSYRLSEDDLEPGTGDQVRLRHGALPPELAKLLGAFAKEGPLAPLLYSVDLLLLYDAMLLKVVPFTDRLWVEKRLQAPEVDTVRSSILRQPAEALAQARAFVFVVAVPWRYMMVLGPRGYRHMMFEAGNLIAQLQFVATHLRLNPALSLDFYDARIDRVLLLDGTERTTLAIVALHGGGL